MPSPNKIKFQLDSWVPVYWAVLLLTIPLKPLACILVSITVHELFHFLAAMILKIPVISIKIHVLRIKMTVNNMSNLQEMICALAGPLGGFFLAGIFHKYPLLSLCALLHSVFNLIPLYPLDGGRAMCSLIGLLFPREKSEWLCRLFQWMILSLLFAACLYGSYRYHTGAPLFLLTVIILQIKIPCKENFIGVQ